MKKQLLFAALLATATLNVAQIKTEGLERATVCKPGAVCNVFCTPDNVCVITPPGFIAPPSSIGEVTVCQPGETCAISCNSDGACVVTPSGVVTPVVDDDTGGPPALGELDIPM